MPSLCTTATPCVWSCATCMALARGPMCVYVGIDSPPTRRYRDMGDVTASSLSSLAHFMGSARRIANDQGVWLRQCVQLALCISDLASQRQAVDAVIRRHVYVDEWVGSATMHEAAQALGQAPRHVATRVLARMLMGVSGLAQPPDLAPTLRLLQSIIGVSNGPGW